MRRDDSLLTTVLAGSMQPFTTMYLESCPAKNRSSSRSTLQTAGHRRLQDLNPSLDPHVPSVIFVVLALWAIGTLAMLIIWHDERPRRLGSYKRAARAVRLGSEHWLAASKPPGFVRRSRRMRVAYAS